MPHLPSPLSWAQRTAEGSGELTLTTGARGFENRTTSFRGGFFRAFLIRRTSSAVAVIIAALALLTLVANVLAFLLQEASPGTMSLAYSATTMALLIAVRLRLDLETPTAQLGVAWIPIVVVFLGIGLRLSNPEPLLADQATILLSLNVAMFEEFLFRHLVLKKFLERPDLAVFVSALLFSCAHLGNFAFGQSVNDTAFQFLYAFVFGAFLSLLRLSFGTLAIPVLFHFIVNNLALSGSWRVETLIFLLAILILSYALWKSLPTRNVRP